MIATAIEYRRNAVAVTMFLVLAASVLLIARPAATRETAPAAAPLRLEASVEKLDKRAGEALVAKFRQRVRLSSPALANKAALPFLRMDVVAPSAASPIKARPSVKKNRPSTDVPRIPPNTVSQERRHDRGPTTIRQTRGAPMHASPEDIFQRKKTRKRPAVRGKSTGKGKRKAQGKARSRGDARYDWSKKHGAAKHGPGKGSGGGGQKKGRGGGSGR
jgi:hypothetical protein